MSERAERRGYVAELDGLRGIAILAVMVHRMYPRAGGTPWPVEAGWAGVDLFFVISGFLIAGILIDTRDQPDYFRNFYARRVLRIFPLFYLLIGGMLLAFPIAQHAEFLHQAGSPLWYLLQLGNIPESLLGRDPPYWLAPVWSLAIEEQFYLSFPLLVRWAEPRRLARWLAAIAVLALVLRIVTTELIPDRERVQYLFTLCRLDTIAIGCLLAVFVRSAAYAAWRPRLLRVLAPVIAASAAVLCVTQLDRTTWFGRTFGYDVLAIGLGAAVLAVFAYRGRPATAILRNIVLRYPGKLCFGLYLLHRPADTVVNALAARAGGDVDSMVWLPVKIAVALAFATASWWIVEQPFLRLKQRFTSSRHPLAVAPAIATIAALLLTITSCRTSTVDQAMAGTGVPDASIDGAMRDAGWTSDADPPGDATGTADAPRDGAPDAAPPALGRVLYSEGQLMSPITADIAAQLTQIAAQTPTAAQVFAKVGDSMTASTSFLTCFDGTGVDLGDQTALADTLAFFGAGNAGGTTPYSRTSLAATGGWMTSDVLAGSPSPLAQELTAIDPRYAVTLLGTNDAREGRTVNAFGADLWTIVDDERARGAIPILSTLPPLHSDADSDAEIPAFNSVVRAIAQGRSVPLIDFYSAMAPLPNGGIGSDGIHPTAAPEGACAMTDHGLGYGYNLRNLLTLEALDRARRACSGQVPDATAPRRSGTGTHADPFVAQLPLADMADTRTGESTFASYAHCALTASGKELVYRLDLSAATAIDAYVIEHAPVDVSVAILPGTLAAASCISAGSTSTSATVGPGPVFIVVDSRTPAAEGEFVVVVRAH